MIESICQAIKHAPQFWWLIVKDLIKYIRQKGWQEFNAWGLHLYVGLFGAGKTITMVRRALHLCQKFRGVTLLTNINVSGFPKDTKIIKLTNSKQILDLPDKSIVLVDEIGSIFNSRDFAASKLSVPKAVYQQLLQMRHRRIMMMGTVQRWNLLDKQLRDIADTVNVCRCWFNHPFCRYVTVRTYNAVDYDKSFQNPLIPIKSLEYYGYIQTDKLRSCYDTMEMVETMLTAEYISDSEILANRAGADFSPADVVGDDKKVKRRFNKGVKKV